MHERIDRIEAQLK